MADELDGSRAAAPPRIATHGSYQVSFAGGHAFRLIDHKATFRVSEAGLSLGNRLVRNLREDELNGRVLDIGTGSGAIALLLRAMGATDIAATDICATAVATAVQNEERNFGSSIIDFTHGDLFPEDADERGPFDLIVFNPPGWRTPSDSLQAILDQQRGPLNLKSMFFGDSVLLRFLEQLPRFLAPGGRAIVGFNSLVGIPDLIGRFRARCGGPTDPIVHFKLLERAEIPMMFYTEEWAEIRASLHEEFERGRDEYSATYITKNDTIHWFYEITELTVGRVEAAAEAVPEQTSQTA